MNLKTNVINIKDKYACLIIESSVYDVCEVLIDIDDIERVKEHCWHLVANSAGNLYAVSTYSKKNGYKGYLHRFIVNCPANKFVDHKNGNTLDNRKCNLRICTPSENMKNTKMRSDNTSGYRYIHFNKQRKVWYVQIKRKRVGTFKNIDEAVKCRNEYLIANCQDEIWARFDRA